MALLLRTRNFGLLWLGGTVSDIGDWVLITALPLYIYQHSGSALATALTLVAKSVPGILLGSVAGVFVDRWNRKSTLVVTNSLLCLSVVVIVLIPITGWLWIAYVSAFAESALSKLSYPAERAFLPELVAGSDLATANSLNGLGDNIARFGGAPLGSVLLGAFGMQACIAVDTLSFLAPACLIALISPSGSREAGPDSSLSEAGSRWRRLWTDWVDGLQAVLEDRFLVLLFSSIGIATLADGSFQALVVPFFLNVLHAKPIIFGSVIVGQGVGGIIGGLVLVAVSAKIRPNLLMSASLAGLAVLFAVIAAVSSVEVLLALSVVAGLLAVGWYASQQTLLQTSVADRFRGRVFGTSNTTTSLLRVCGLGIAGALADRAGIVPLVFAVATLYGVASLLALRLGSPGVPGKSA